MAANRHLHHHTKHLVSSCGGPLGNPGSHGYLATGRSADVDRFGCRGPLLVGCECGGTHHGPLDRARSIAEDNMHCGSTRFVPTIGFCACSGLRLD